MRVSKKHHSADVITICILLCSGNSSYQDLYVEGSNPSQIFSDSSTVERQAIDSWVRIPLLRKQDGGVDKRKALVMLHQNRSTSLL